MHAGIHPPGPLPLSGPDPPESDTPGTRHPPEQTPHRIQSPPPDQTPAYGQRAKTVRSPTVNAFLRFIEINKISRSDSISPHMVVQSDMANLTIASCEISTTGNYVRDYHVTQRQAGLKSDTRFNKAACGFNPILQFGVQLNPPPPPNIEN